LFKIIPLLLLPLIGLFWINIDHFQIPSPSQSDFWGSLNAAAFLTLWGFVGLETGTVPGEQVDNPSKTIPRAVLMGTFIAMLVYILGTIAIIGIIPCDILASSKAPYADIASHIFGGNWGGVVSSMTIISIIGALYGWIFVVGQIPLSAVKDGLFPKIFGKVNRFDSPHVSILISSFCTLTLVFISHDENLGKQFQSIIEVSLTLIFTIYFLCVLSFIKLTRKERPLSFSEIMLSSSSLIFILWAMWAASLEMVALSLLGFLSGVPVYLWVKRKII
jgi:APA family basic amino acid/polyamine antiporter